MAAKKQDAWVSASEAAQLLTKNTDHPVSADYVRLLAKTNKIASKYVNGREKVYLRSDAETYRVKRKDAPRVRPRKSTRQPREGEERAA